MRRTQTISIATALSVMGLCESSTPEQIKRAYRRLAMQTHPDKGGATADFIRVKDAYDCLVERGTVVQKPSGNYWVHVHIPQWVYVCTATSA